MEIKIIEVSFLQTNCLLIWDETSRNGIVVDPGGKNAKIIEWIENANLNITHILITHGHFDHVGGVKAFVSVLEEKGQSPKVCMHGIEKVEMESGAKKQHKSQFFDLNIDLAKQEKLDLGFIEFDLIVVPGHTNYSVCFYNEDNKLLISGDTLFSRTIGTSAYYTGLDTDLRENIKRKLLVLPEDTSVYPGHGAITTIKEEKTMNPFLA